VNTKGSPSKERELLRKVGIPSQSETSETNQLVIGKQRGAFKRTFEAAQKQLRSKFGMEMVELPAREKVTMKEKRGQSALCYQYVMLTSKSGEQD
jgi:hypothetical protein